MNTLKRIMAVWLAVIMLSTLVPLSAFADEPPQDGFCTEHALHDEACGYAETTDADALVAFGATAASGMRAMAQEVYTLSGAIVTYALPFLAIGGATVRLYKDGASVGTTTSADNGEYSFDGLEPGDYTVTVPAGIYTGVYYQEASATVTIETTNKVVLIRLTPGNAPDTYSISGTVNQNVSMSPIRNATVELYDDSGRIQTTTTDSIGKYAFYSLSNKNYTVKVPAGTYTGVYYLENSQTVTIAGDNKSVSITLNPGNEEGKYSISGTVIQNGSLSIVGSATVELYDGNNRIDTTTSDSFGNYAFYSLENKEYTLKVPAGTYSGVYYQEMSQTVTIANGNKSVSINLNPGNAPGTYSISGMVTEYTEGSLTFIKGAAVELYSGDSFIKTTTCDNFGDYTFYSLADGNYTVKMLAGTYGGVYYQEKSQTVNVAGGNKSVSISPTRGNAPNSYAISGYVTVGYDFAGIRNVSVELYSGSTKLSSTTTNAAGEYTFNSIAPGTYVLRLNSAIYAAQDGSVTVSNASASKSFNAYPRTSNSVSGKVTSGGAGVSGVTISLSDRDSGLSWQTTTTGAGGTYTFADVGGAFGDSVDYIVAVQDGEYGGQWYTGASETVRVIDGNVTDVDLMLTVAAPPPSTAPTAPGNLSATPGSQQISLSWITPDDGGSAITKYQYSATTDADSWQDIPGSDATTTSYTVTGLTNGTTYTVKVRAVNAVGDGAAATTTATPQAAVPTAPAAPVSLAATGGYKQISLTWTTPSDGGSAITKYQYSVSTGADNWQDMPSSGAVTVRYTITGLNNGTAYTVKVRAVNGIGNGAEASASATPLATGNYDIAGEIRDQDDETINIDGIRVQLYCGGEYIRSTPVGNGSYFFLDLPNGSYTLEVAAGTYNGRSYPKTSINVTIDNDHVFDGIFNLTLTNPPGTYSISGHANFDGGGPAVALTIDLYSGGSKIGSTQTDNDGDYAFHGLAPGSYVLRLNNTGSIANDAAVTLYGQDAEGQDMSVLIPTTNSVSGIVKTADGSVVAGVTVNLCDDRSGLLRKTTTTDASGEYEFASVGAGESEMEYVVVVPDGNYGGQWYAGGSDIASLKNYDTICNITITPIASVTPLDNTFAAATEGYSPAAMARQFTITNKGTDPITGLTASLQKGGASGFAISTALSATTVNAGNTVTVSVSPKASLAPSATPYTDKLIIADNSGITLIADLSFTVNAAIPPAITTSALPNGMVGTAYSQTLAATGTTPITWTITAGNLPGGLTLSGGVIAGTPTTVGTYTFTVKAANIKGDDTKALSIQIVPIPAVTSVTVSPTTVNVQQNTTQQFTASVAAVGGASTAVTWDVSNGNGSTNINASGLLTVDASEPAGTVLNVTATSDFDGSKIGTAAVTVTDTPAVGTVPSITTTALPNGTTGTAYSETLAVTGTEPITWSVTTGDLPDGLTLSSDGTIDGTPTAAGTFAFTVKAENGKGSDTKILSIAIDPVFINLPGPITGSQTSADFTVNGKFVDLFALDMNGNPLIIDRTNPARLLISGWPGYSGTIGEAVSGSVIITLYQPFLASLPNGNYTLTTVFQEGGTAQPYASPVAQFVIARQPAGPTGTISSGGGGGGGSSPATTNAEVTTYPSSPTTALLRFATAPDPNGGLTFAVTKEMVQQALSKAKAEAKKQGRERNGYALALDFGTQQTIHRINITLNVDVLALLESAGVIDTSVLTNTFRFGFDLAALHELNKQSGGKAVTVSASRFAKLSDAARVLIGSRPVWDVTITNLSDLGEGTITMGMRYTPAPGEKTGNLAAVYVPGSGKPQILAGSGYNNGWVNWRRNSLSVYGVGYIPAAPAFTDTAGHWAKDAIDFITSRGLISGSGAAAFSPERAITRAEFLMALGRLSGADVSGYTTSSFTDVQATDALPYIEWAVANGIVQGIGNHQFGPGLLITREDMAVMMVNYAKATGYTIPVSSEKAVFADASGISAYAGDAVTAIQQAGIIIGRGENQFAPKANATRAEAAVILRRFVELVIDAGTARGWVQNDAGQWQYMQTNGRPTTGWLDTTEGGRYWFDDKAVMASGKWVEIDGKWYYFYSDGRMAVNTSVDGYTVGEDGARD